MGVLAIRALQYGLCNRVPECWKLSCIALIYHQQSLGSPSLPSFINMALQDYEESRGGLVKARLWVRE